ncbi:kinesin-like protein KIFC3 [Spea bombifrons]|uniref:kinesin-like protein KIFC3 n=1 Tax=Spea bombifrons TaxID=233779 RepID=UPI002349C266|nr:kinesin-like protein KIFC3 [Spea bombifrons]
MGTGASKRQTAEKHIIKATEERPSVIQNGSASTLPDNTSIGKQRTQSKDEEIAEDIEQMVQSVCRPAENTEEKSTMQRTLEAEDVSMTFESFLHKNGTLYTCFTQNGTRLYFDDEKGIVPFPEELYSQGKFIHQENEPDKTPGNIKEDNNGFPSYLESERTSSIYIPGKGMVMTYIFEERTNVCKYFDSDSGAWLILPMLWEMNLDFITQRVQQVKEALPSIMDYKEILAALRLSNYDPDEVISVFYAIFGDSVADTITGQENVESVVLTRNLYEKEKEIENVSKKLKERDQELESLRSKCKYLEEEKEHLIHRTESLHDRVEQLQVEHEKCLNELSALSEIQRENVQAPTPIQSSIPLKIEVLRKLLREARDLNFYNHQLRIDTKSDLLDIGQHLTRLRSTMENMKKSNHELEEIRALYQRESLERKLLYNQLQELRGNIRVFCRCRRDDGKGEHLEFPSNEEILVNHNGSKKKFRFDKVFEPQCTQEDVFEGTLPIIRSCVDGYNVCILAYGQTGSGKTYTMMGNEEKPGVNIRSIRELLRICQGRERIKYTIKISMVEIYNETVWDLLSQNGNTQLEIRSQGKLVTLLGLTEMEVSTEDDIKKTMSFGEKNRTVASTKMNTESSRSHLMVIMRVNSVDSISGVVSSATLTLCDLAGSERISKTEATGQRLVEAAAINKSLTALGQVFAALKGNSLHVPYRNSKLTHLLQPSLSGHAKACVFVNISPDIKDFAETLSSLQFGSSIQQIALGKPMQNSVKPAH